MPLESLRGSTAMPDEPRDISVILEKPECGICEVSRAEYDAIPAMNCSSIKAGVDIDGRSYVGNPRLIRHAWQNPGGEERTAAQQDTLDFGTAMHLAVLEPTRFADEVVHFSGTRRGKKWDEFCEEHQGKLILKTSGKHGYDNIGKVLNAITELAEFELLDPYLAECQREIAVVHYENGMAKKGLLDMPSKSGRAYLDLKTTAVASWSKYDNVSFSLGYWLSMGSYAKWWNEYSPWKIERCIQVVVVVTPPYDLLIRPMDPMSLNFGWETQLRACDALRDAIRTDTWYGTGGGLELPLLLPTWAIPDDTEFT